MSDLFGGALSVDLASQIAEVERELAMRRKLYPRWVDSGSLSRAVADRQIDAMEAVRATLQRLYDGGAR